MWLLPFVDSGIIKIKKEIFYEKENIFYPPPKKSDNLAGTSFRKILCLSSCAIIGLISLGCSNVTAQDQASALEKAVQISSFSDYPWDTSYDDIYSDQITSDMKEAVDYQRDESNGISALTLLHQEVAGYSDVSSSYLFSDNKLVAGSYDLDIDDETFDDLSEKIVKIYGKSCLEKESTGWGKLSIWIDDSKDVITLSEMLGITFFEADSPCLEFLNDQFIEFHDVDLVSEIKKYNNLEGLSGSESDSSNPLLNAQIVTAPVKSGDNSKTLGTYAYISIAKDILKTVTLEQFTEFAQTVVDNSGYNWFSIICEDGTGICFSGSDIYYPSYGKLDTDGAITDGYGDITWDFDTNSYVYTPRQ